MTGIQIVLIGCGKMGGALLESWAGQSSVRYDIHVVETSGRPPPVSGASVTVSHYRGLAEIPAEVAPDIVLFAVKPQSLHAVVADYFAEFGLDPLYLSVAAGKTLRYYQQRTDAAARIVRAMPNAPALVGRGVTVMVGTPNLAPEDKRTAQVLMEACGLALWIEDETQMDVVTAISGSGPAYVFYFMECLTRTAMDHGMEEEMARTLVMHTLLGSAELAFLSKEPLHTLRRHVASPGGTTEAALEYLMNPSGMLPLLQQAVEAAIARAGELSAQK